MDGLTDPTIPPRRRTGRRLLQWEGMDDEEAPQLLKEMHEHLDVRFYLMTYIYIYACVRSGSIDGIVDWGKQAMGRMHDICMGLGIGLGLTEATDTILHSLTKRTQI